MQFFLTPKFFVVNMQAGKRKKREKIIITAAREFDVFVKTMGWCACAEVCVARGRNTYRAGRRGARLLLESPA